VDLPVAAETEDRRDAVASIHAEVAHIIDVAVRVDEARNNGLSGCIDALVPGRRFHGRPDRFDLAVANNESRVLHGRLARAINNAGAYKSDNATGAGLRSRPSRSQPQTS